MKTLIRKNKENEWFWSVLENNTLIGWGREASKSDAEYACNTFVQQQNVI
jgi:hypothetical protein